MNREIEIVSDIVGVSQKYTDKEIRGRCRVDYSKRVIGYLNEFRQVEELECEGALALRHRKVGFSQSMHLSVQGYRQKF